MISEGRKDALIKLLDDESPVVRQAVVAEIRNQEDDGVVFLREVARQRGSGIGRHARSLLVELGFDDPHGDFRSFIRSFRYELEVGCFLLERTVHPDLEWSMVAGFIDEVATRCRELIVPESSVFEKCKQLNCVFYHEYGFSGDLEDFENPDNNFISSVIYRRKGIPISLSVLYLLVADRCSITLDPIGTPGRFLLANLEDPNSFYLDPFDRGRFRSEEEVRQMLLTHHIEDGAEYLLPSTTGEVLCRFCRNLAHQYTLKNEMGKARQFTGYIQEFEDVYERESS
tara:strand:+ start:27441 stop:28295 length:855 start_codon:yes stop_codon:yes gene_type:complete